MPVRHLIRLKCGFATLIGTIVLFTGCTTAGGDVMNQPSVRANDDASFRVMSFNIRYNTPNDAENAWPNRKDMVAGVIRFHDADFAGLQEALLGQIEDLEARLPQYEWIGVGRADGVSEGEFTPIFYRPDRFEVLDHDTFWLSESPEVPGSKSWDAALERIATWGLFRDRRTGSRFILLNTHFDHVGREARQESASLILAQLDDIAPELPTIVTGDFNTTDDSEPYRVLTNSDTGLRDAYVVTQQPHYGPTSSWSGFEAVAEDRRIDFVFVNEDVDVLRHGILSETLDGRFPSDHLPVLAEVAVQ